MSIRLRGHNAWWDGWLCRCFGGQYDSDKVMAWIDGWNAADSQPETGRMVRLMDEVGRARRPHEASNILIEEEG